MSEVSPTQTHDGMGALRAGNTVESLRPRQGLEMNKDGPFQSERPQFEVNNNDFVMVESEPTVSQYFENISKNPHINEQLADQGLKLNLPEPNSARVRYTPADPAGLNGLDTIVEVFRTLVQLYDTIEAVQARVAALESRLEDHNVRGSHKI